MENFAPFTLRELSWRAAALRPALFAAERACAQQTRGPAPVDFPAPDPSGIAARWEQFKALHPDLKG